LLSVTDTTLKTTITILKFFSICNKEVDFPNNPFNFLFAFGQCGDLIDKDGRLEFIAQIP